MSIHLTSNVFENGKPIPRKYTGEAEDISPPLEWGPAPEGTKSFALIADDPDAPVGTWVHWVLYGLPGDLTRLPENVPPAERIPNGALQGLNDFGHVGYGGPMPPPGKPHRYFFTLFALDQPLTLNPKATKEELLQAMQGHILGKTQIMGTYQR